ncbi:hypothetical protein L4E02_006477, partial [Pseudomonas aeruginosa]
MPVLHAGQLMGANFICLYFAWSSTFSGLILFSGCGAMNGFFWILECRYVWRWWRFRYWYFNRMFFFLNVFLSESFALFKVARIANFLLFGGWSVRVGYIAGYVVIASQLQCANSGQNEKG